MNGFRDFCDNLSKGLRNALLVFWACGLFGLLIDSDHFIRCLQDQTWRCVIDPGAKLFHTWVGFAICVLYGVGGSLLLGYVHRLVDDSARITTHHYPLRH